MSLTGICCGSAGRELTVPHQMSLAGAVSIPVFWLAGAGAAVFWVLGNPNSTTCSFIIYILLLGVTLFVAVVSKSVSEYWIKCNCKRMQTLSFLTWHSTALSDRSDAARDRLSRRIPQSGGNGHGRAPHGTGVKEEGGSSHPFNPMDLRQTCSHIREATCTFCIPVSDLCQHTNNPPCLTFKKDTVIRTMLPFLTHFYKPMISILSETKIICLLLSILITRS